MCVKTAFHHNSNDNSDPPTPGEAHAFELGKRIRLGCSEECVKAYRTIVNNRTIDNGGHRPNEYERLNLAERARKHLLLGNTLHHRPRGLPISYYRYHVVRVYQNSIINNNNNNQGCNNSTTVATGNSTVVGDDDINHIINNNNNNQYCNINNNNNNQGNINNNNNNQGSNNSTTVTFGNSTVIGDDDNTSIDTGRSAPVATVNTDISTAISGTSAAVGITSNDINSAASREQQTFDNASNTNYNAGSIELNNISNENIRTLIFMIQLSQPQLIENAMVQVLIDPHQQQQHQDLSSLGPIINRQIIHVLQLSQPQIVSSAMALIQPQNQTGVGRGRTATFEMRIAEYEEYIRRNGHANPKCNENDLPYAPGIGFVS